MYERKPAIGEFLYFEKDGSHVFSHPIKEAHYNIYKEGGKYFLSLHCDALPPAGGGRHYSRANSHPLLEVSLMFDKNPKPEIAEGRRFKVKPYDEVFCHITTLRYTSIWGNLHNGAVTVNQVEDQVLDVTIVGKDSDSDLGRVAVRARFQYSPEVVCDFY